MNSGPGRSNGSRMGVLWGVFVTVSMFLWVSCADRAMVEIPNDARSPVVLSAQVDRAEATPGDIVRYTVTLERDPEISVEMPDVFSQIRGLKVSEIRKEEPVTRDGRILEKEIFDLQAFKVGSYVLPALKLSYLDKKGSEQTTGSPQIFVEIKSVLEKDAENLELADIKPMEKPPVEYTRLLLAGAGGACLLLITACAVYLVRRQRRAKAPPLPPPPPWEVALEALQVLEKAALIESGDPRTYCYSLSEIFRRYLENRYHFPALEETTEEVLASFQQAEIPYGKPRDLARRLLTGADWVKYARQTPSRDEAEGMLQTAREFIEATIPPPPEPTSGNQAKEVS